MQIAEVGEKRNGAAGQSEPDGQFDWGRRHAIPPITDFGMARAEGGGIGTMIEDG